MKKRNLFAVLFSLALSMGFVACSDDDDVLPLLKTPALENTGSTYNSLSFSWDKIPEAIQYGYQLTDMNDNAVISGVIKDTKVKISGLKADTEYKLRVWPFAGLNVNYSTPAAVELTGKTAPIIQLATPVINVTLTGSTAVIEWELIENAKTYAWTIDGPKSGKGEISGNKVTRRNLEDGEYKVTVQAKTDQGGFSNSEIATYTFQLGEVVNPDEVPLWSVTGDYYVEWKDETSTRTLEANRDGTYTLKAFMGYEGYDLVFSVDGNDITFLNGLEVDGYPAYNYLYYSPDDEGIFLYVNDKETYTYFEGDENGGSMWFWYRCDDWDTWSADEFTWGKY